MTKVISIIAALLFATVAQAQSSYKVGDVWTPQGHPTRMIESFVEGFAGWTSNSTNYVWHTQPLTASPSGVQTYDNILSGNTTWGMQQNCIGTWNADYPSLLPITPNSLPCVTMTAHFVSGAWHSGVIASTNPDGTAITANPAGALGNRFIIQVLARMPDINTGLVSAGFTPAIWINNALSSGGCTHEFDVVEVFGNPFYHFSSHHCWQAGTDTANATASLEDAVLNPGAANEVDDLTGWHWWILDAMDSKQVVWSRDGKVSMVVPRDPNNGDVRYDLMIANQVGCCGWPAPTDTTKTATMQVGAIVIR